MTTSNAVKLTWILLIILYHRKSIKNWYLYTGHKLWLFMNSSIGLIEKYLCTYAFFFKLWSTGLTPRQPVYMNHSCNESFICSHTHHSIHDTPNGNVITVNPLISYASI